MRNLLFDRFLAHTGRTIHKLDSYFEVYERHFDRFTANGPSMLVVEIGIGLGGSLQMWKEYFGTRAQIVGLDVREECRDFEEERIAVRIGSQSDQTFLQAVLDEFGIPDIVIDDGSHLGPDQVATFNFLYPRIAASGVYLVEDLHCAYLPQFDGGLKVPATFIETVCKPAIDEINATWWRESGGGFDAVTRSLHFYDSIAVFERGHVANPKRSRRIPEPEPGVQISWPRHEG